MGTDDVSLTGLRVLRRVVETGSFAAAADDLGYTQSAVSRQMAALERAVGETLFERGRRGVTPTPAGEVVLATADRVLAEIDHARERLGSTRDRAIGRVALGAFPSAAAVLLPRAIAAASADHPGLRLSLEEAPSPTLVRRVRSGRLDVAVVAIGTGPDESELDGLRQTELRRIGLCVAVADTHRLARRVEVQVDELAGERWIAGAGTPGDPQFRGWPSLPDPEIAFTVRHWPTRLGLVAAGLGISVIPGAAALSVPRGITVLAVDDPARPRRAGVVITAQDRSPQSRILVDALRSQANALADRLSAS